MPGTCSGRVPAVQVRAEEGPANAVAGGAGTRGDWEHAGAKPVSTSSVSVGRGVELRLVRSSSWYVLGCFWETPQSTRASRTLSRTLSRT